MSNQHYAPAADGAAMGLAEAMSYSDCLKIDAYWMLYELGEKLADLEDCFRRWRFNHVTTVERVISFKHVIGFKRGTGGTSGVSYLRCMLDVELFPELWHLRGEL